MDLISLIRRVRTNTRDFNSSIFREQDIIDFINEGLDRCKQVVTSLETAPYLVSISDVVTIMPSEYHSILSIYATARCYSQDEREFKAMSFMNEFEEKLQELKFKIDSGEILILDAYGVDLRYNFEDYVVDNYFKRVKKDLDDGIGGVTP